MNSCTVKSLYRSLLGSLVLLLVVGCASDGAGFPRVASPPPFDYVDGEELRSGMHQLAFELQRLDISLMAIESRDSVSQLEVVGSLRNIERLAGAIRAGDLSSRHTFLRNDMSGFISTVTRARMSAERNPPNYYMAGRVSGACVNCHQVNS